MTNIHLFTCHEPKEKYNIPNKKWYTNSLNLSSSSVTLHTEIFEVDKNLNPGRSLEARAEQELTIIIIIRRITRLLYYFWY